MEPAITGSRVSEYITERRVRPLCRHELLLGRKRKRGEVFQVLHIGCALTCGLQLGSVEGIALEGRHEPSEPLFLFSTDDVAVQRL